MIDPKLDAYIAELQAECGAYRGALLELGRDDIVARIEKQFVSENEAVTVCHICGEPTSNYCDPCGKPACRDCASTSMAYGIETYACGDCRRSKEDSE